MLKRIAELENSKPIDLPPSTDGTLDAAALSQLLKDYAKKSDINSINSRLDKLEKDFGDMSDR